MQENECDSIIWCRSTNTVYENVRKHGVASLCDKDHASDLRKFLKERLRKTIKDRKVKDLLKRLVKLT